MIGYIKRHESYVKDILEKNPGAEAIADLLAYHDRQILWIQHERLAHLITLLFVCLFALLVLGFTILNPDIPFFILAAILILLSAAYVIHYYRLENGVQRLYGLSNQIHQRFR